MFPIGHGVPSRLMTIIYAAITRSSAPDCPVGAREIRHLGSISATVRLLYGLVAKDLLRPKGIHLDKKPCLTGT
jgi:hypothetical protein